VTRSGIDLWLRISGNLEGEAELQIEGHIHGGIRCIKLVISRGATVDGNVTADEIIIRGTVTGGVRGNRVVLQEGACVRNEIHYKRLCIEEDAVFEGSISLRDDVVDELRAAAAEMRSARKAKAKADQGKPAAKDALLAVQAEKGPDADYARDSERAALAEAESGTCAVAAGSDVKRMRAQLRDRRPL
jgi:cytoskeletal protein CcmA (bactofilin family)